MLAGWPADQRAEIEHRDEGDRFEDADNGEPAAAEPDRLAEQGVADAEARSSGGPEDNGRVLRRGLVEPRAGGDACADCLEQVEAGGEDGEATRLALGDTVAAIDLCVSQESDRAHRLHR